MTDLLTPIHGVETQTLPVAEQKLTESTPKFELLDAMPPKLKEELAAGVKSFWDTTCEYEPQLDTPEERAAALERDENFFLKVYNGAMLLANRNTNPQTGELEKTVTMLFDADETILSLLEDSDGNSAIVARPAFRVAVEAVRSKLGDKFEIGMLTTHDESRLVSELNSPTYLNGLDGIVNPKFILSSKISKENQELHELEAAIDSNNVTVTKAATSDILDPIIAEYDDEVDGWGSIKLVILQRTVVANPDRVFGYVDDLPSAAAIDPDSERVHGVWVGTEVHDMVRRLAVTALGDDVTKRIKEKLAA